MLKKVTFEVDSDVWEFFERICKERQRDPGEEIAFQIKEEVECFFTSIEAEFDPLIRGWQQSLKEFFQTAARVLPSQWPFSERGKPKSFEAAVRNAKRRGKRLAEKRAAA